MLGERAENGQTAAPVLSVVRELLAKNIAARNPDLETRLFPAVVNQILFALVAARLLESAGCIRGHSIDDLLRDQGLLKGLSVFFDMTGKRDNRRLVRSPVASEDDGPLFRFPHPDIDKNIQETVITLTAGPGFINEWKNYRSGTGMATFSSFLMQQVRLSSENRMVLEDTAGSGNHFAVSALPGTYVRGIYANVLDKALSGKSPVSGGARRILDPCCGTGESLCVVLASLFKWHLTWYGEHLVPLLREGKDPLSRSIQQIIPKPVEGIATPGFRPLPLYNTGNGEFALSWGEKARILSESVFGMDNDPQAVMITRLQVLSLFLEDLQYPDLVSFRPDMIIRVLFRNIRPGDVRMRGLDYKTSRDRQSPWQAGDSELSTINDIFPCIGPECEFDLVIGSRTEAGADSGNDACHYRAGSRRAGNHIDDPEPFFIGFGISVLRPGGIYCGIGAGRWLRASYASQFRAWLAAYQLNEIITFRVMRSNRRNDAVPVVTCITNAPAVSPFTVAIAGDLPGQEIRDGKPLLRREVDQRTLSGKPWQLFPVSPLKLRNLIRDHGSPLSQALLGELFRSDTKYPSQMVINRETASRLLKKDPIVRSFLLPFIREEDILPYNSVRTGQYIVVIPEGTAKKLAGKEDDPASWFSLHHATFFNLLNEISRPGDGLYREKTGCWWEWKGAQVPKFLRGPVLLFSRGSSDFRPGWAWAPDGAYPGPGVVALPARDPALVGILNSTVFWFYMLSSGEPSGINRYWEEGLSEFPLYIPDPECGEEWDCYASLTRLVKRRLALVPEPGNPVSGREQGRINQEAANCERAIDQCVYKLYRMSDDDALVAEYFVSEYRQTLHDTGIHARRNRKIPV